MRRCLLSVALVALSVSSALALWAPVPFAILVDEADLIVVGKVAKIQDGGFALGKRNYDVAVVEVSAVLKSLAGKPKEVHIGQPAEGGGIAVSTDIRFRAGQQGIWLLTKDPDKNVYWARHPFQFQEEKEQKQLVTLIDSRAKAPAGKAVNGLVARAELLEHGQAKGPPFYEVRFSLKNVSEKPITICDFAVSRPLQVTWTGPDGKSLDSNHYKWLEVVRLGLAKENFVTIPAGGVRFLGPRTREYGVMFQAKAPAHMNNAEAGQHKVTVSFVSDQDGREFGVENVWKGTVRGPEISFTVK